MSCPSDGDQDGFRNVGSGNGDGQDISTTSAGVAVPPPPGGGTPMIPVENYLGSFGDNYCIGCNSSMQFPTETPISVWPPVPGQPRIGWPGEQGTMLNITCGVGGASVGVLRGMFDVSDGQTVTLASVTDGTSNTIAAGEGLPAQRADNNVWEWNSGANGTTVPMNYFSGLSCGSTGGWNVFNWAGRCAYTNTGFKSKHPGGCNFLFADGSVHFLKQSINMFTYCASAAATAVRSSVPTPTDQNRNRACVHLLAHPPSDCKPGGGSARIMTRVQPPFTVATEHVRECKSGPPDLCFPSNLMATINRLPRRLPAVLAVPALFVLGPPAAAKPTVLANAFPSPAPSPITAVRLRRARSVSFRKT